MFPLLVVDQNQLRNAQAIAHVILRCREESLYLLIPEGAGFEMSKSSEVWETWRNSLRLLTPCWDLVVVSRKMTDLMRAEVATGKPANSFVDHAATETFQQILADLESGNDASLRRIVEGPVKEKMPISRNAWSDAEMHRSWIIQLRDLLKAEITDREVKELRRAPSSELASWLSTANGVRFVYQGIVSRGADDVTALRLASTPSVTGAFLSALALIALHWLAFGGLEAAKPEKVTNDLHDAEYAVFGSLSVDLRSADRKLQEIHSAVTAARLARHSWIKHRLGITEFNRLNDRAQL